MRKFTDKINESIEDKIPTAKDLLFNILGAVKCDNEIDYLQSEDGKEELDWLIDVINNRTRLHVEAALKEAYENAEIESCGNPYDPEDDSQCISKNSILNSYPLENIK